MVARVGVAGAGRFAGFLGSVLVVAGAIDGADASAFTPATGTCTGCGRTVREDGIGGVDTWLGLTWTPASKSQRPYQSHTPHRSTPQQMPRSYAQTADYAESLGATSRCLSYELASLEVTLVRFVRGMTTVGSACRCGGFEALAPGARAHRSAEGSGTSTSGGSARA